MSKRPRNRAVDIQTAQQQALDFAKQWLGANGLGLPSEMTEDEYAHTMNTITRGLVQAYAKGFMDALEGA